MDLKKEEQEQEQENENNCFLNQLGRKNVNTF